MTPVDQQQVDRILAVVDALKSTAKSLERLHEEEAGWAIEYFDRAPSLDMAAIIGHGGLKGSSHRP